MTSANQQIRAYYQALYSALGRQHWWPASNRFEVIVGAYLTQNTSWKNVEIALRQLRAARQLRLAAIRSIPLDQLEALIRPSGYFRQKAARLKIFVAFVDQAYGGSLHRMFAQPTDKLRQELLSLNGVGPETADSILLYAGQHAVFVVDAYSRRILERHGIADPKMSYEEVRKLFEQSLREVAEAPNRMTQALENAVPSFAHSPSAMSLARRSPLAQIYNDMHGLIVVTGKQYCLKADPRCQHCPLRTFLPEDRPRVNPD
jgi:endonuclease-3 related protein